MILPYQVWQALDGKATLPGYVKVSAAAGHILRVKNIIMGTAKHRHQMQAHKKLGAHNGSSVKGFGHMRRCAYQMTLQADGTPSSSA